MEVCQKIIKFLGTSTNPRKSIIPLLCIWENEIKIGGKSQGEYNIARVFAFQRIFKMTLNK